MGNLFRHHRPLLDADAGLFATTEGTSYQLRPRTSDAVEDHLQSFAVVFEPGESDGSATPSVQTSWDEVHCLTVASLNGKSAGQTMKVSVLGRYVRGVVTIGEGGAFGGSIRLISDASFRLV